MKYLTIYFLLIIISCLFILQTNAVFSKDSKKKDSKGQCNLYKGRCGGALSNTCCKTPLKCAKQTEICGKDKLCCVTEADIQRHKQATGAWLKNRNG
ncbi:unnamed protein product [Rotaria sordida]|uniref:Uncharacterized protein n=1 Tax=Rotaria sordida TaxID=392033 RepID=A0A819R0I2_9BILA|nr:unnamed protein product [Rotaria sordida]CAF0897599.1 unnamed protein product [Rotaria sordida]CAF1334188.1 unnamed protein product [Rotaria sordida]CAF1337500.1 unnamed protein product [Rotaria sordida]CAF1369800.1 unnamed protein product [Rotaria sordida]